MFKKEVREKKLGGERSCVKHLRKAVRSLVQCTVTIREVNVLVFLLEHDVYLCCLCVG